MKIVVVDHVYLEKEHIQKLQSLGNLEVFDEPARTDDDLKNRIKDAEIVIVGWSHLTRDTINSAKRLRMISIWATTCHYVDLQAAKEKGVVVTHVPGYATEAVAEHVFALLLATVRKLVLADKDVRRGNFDWRPFDGIELSGKTIGIIGTGSIGCRVAEIAKSFNMKVLGYDKYPHKRNAEDDWIEYVDLHKLLRESDIVTLHVTLTPETNGLIGKKEIDSMKHGAVIVNTSQGRVIDEKLLIDALKSGKISSAGLDVFEDEPPVPNNPLFALDNTVLSPHIGFHTLEAKKRCSDLCVVNVVNFLKGQFQNTC